MWIVTRRHGWGGTPPASDAEASARIVAAAVALMDSTRAEINIADVARSLGVIRQTVYRYFPSADALMEAAAVSSVGAFLDRMEEHLRGVTDAGEAVVEGIAYVMETLPATPHMNMLLSPLRPNRFSVAITSDQARAFGRSMLDRFDVDWGASGFDDAALDELTEFVLRTIQSFIIDPGQPERDGAELRGYLQRWVGAAVTAHHGGLSSSRPRRS